jgi:signal transduction histidine kinase
VIFRGLKAKIAINIAILLFLAMLLIDVVTIATVKRELIRSAVFRADLLINSVKHGLMHHRQELVTKSEPSVSDIVLKVVSDPQVGGAVILNKAGKPIFLHQPSNAQLDSLNQVTRDSMASGERKLRVQATIWGMFWGQKAELALAVPLVGNGGTLGAIGIVLPLENVYQALRNSQQIFFVYLLINLVILTFVGIVQISKLYLQPLARLAKRADDYQEDDALIFAVRKEDNELSRLSKSLNVMLSRISADKEKLRSTVQSLEQANHELKKAQQEIIRAEKLASVGRLSAGIAHEIGNPIGIVIGYLDLLKQTDVTDEEQVEYIQRAEEEIERINTIIRQLLEVSRPSNMGRTTVAVHDLIEDLAHVLRMQPLLSGIALTLDLNSAEHTVWADANQLRQVFLNLIINAADAINSDSKEVEGRVTIGTRLISDDDPDLGQISFTDNGSGIAEESLDNIFDPFFTTKDPGKGTGLGLSVSFTIIESLGGKMTGVSQEGNGTTMIISLPLRTLRD